jgi:hypothetical protein
MTPRDLDEVFEETGLGRYKPVPPWLFHESENVRHRVPSGKKRRREYENYAVVMECTSKGACSVKLFDTSRGYDKLVGRSTGLNEWQAQDLFLELSDKAREGIE